MDQLQPGAYTDPVVGRSPAQNEDRGVWQAVVFFRKTDGENLQWELHAWGDTADAARQAAISAIDQERGSQVQTMGFDTPAVRKYISAASHMHDLRQAISALDAAANVDDADIRRHLRVQAMSIYGRTWGSRGRDDLAAYIHLSVEDAKLTESIRILRNRFTAHSESTMTTTVPLFDMERQLGGSVELVKVRSMTFEQPLPLDFIERVRNMIEHLIAQLTEALEVLKRPILEEATPEMLRALFQRPEILQLRTVNTDEWSPDDRRPPFPSLRFRDIHLRPGDDGSIIVTLTH